MTPWEPASGAPSSAPPHQVFSPSPILVSLSYARPQTNGLATQTS